MSEPKASNGNSWQNVVALVAAIVSIVGAMVLPGYIMIRQNSERLKEVEDHAARARKDLEERLYEELRQIDERGTTGVLADIAKLKERDREAETQFDAAAALSNLEADATHTKLSLLWEKVFGAKLPERRTWPGFEGRDIPNGNGHASAASR